MLSTSGRWASTLAHGWCAWGPKGCRCTHILLGVFPAHGSVNPALWAPVPKGTRPAVTTRIVYDGPSTGLDTKQLIDIYGPEFEDAFWETKV